MSIQPLYIFDYDGVWVKISEESYSIMRSAIGVTIQRHNDMDPGLLDGLNWKSIFDITKGTTEHTFVTTVFKNLQIPIPKQESLFVQFIQERASLITEFSQKHGLRKFDDNNVYFDTQRLVESLRSRFPNALFALASGNPLWVVEQRLPQALQDVFDIRIGGEYGNTRKDMLQLAAIHAKKLGWKPWRDETNMLVNAFYFDDAKAGVLSALEAGYKTIYLDRPEHTSVHSFRDLSVYNYRLEKEMRDIFGPRKTEFMIVGSEKAKTTQSLFTTETLDNQWLLIPKEGVQLYDGWLDPQAHALWQIHSEEREFIRVRKEA